jgi:helix-turn-helix protein
MTISRDFKGIWIPKEVWLDKSLNYFEKCLLAEIHSLNGDNGCFASNQYLCEFFNERERKIQDGLAKLKATGYIYVESFDGRTRILRTNLYPSKDKSLFSTPEVLDSAPLPCPIPHPSLYIDKSIEKRQQQEAAAVSSEKVYDCLTHICIPRPDMIWISKNYPEEIVIQSVLWATNPTTKINSTLQQAIKWACINKPEIPKTATASFTENKDFVNDLKTKIKPSNLFRLDSYNSYAEITPLSSSAQPFILSYSEKGFKEQLLNALRKYQLL